MGERETGWGLTIPVLALTALGFALGICEFVIVGILPEIAADMAVSLSAVGKLVSVFAACYAVGTPVITAATGGIPQFRLLMGLMGLFLVVNLLRMLAPSVMVLYVSRVLAALVSGPLTAVAMLFAKDVAVPGHTARCTPAFPSPPWWMCPLAPPCARRWAGGGPSRCLPWWDWR